MRISLEEVKHVARLGRLEMGDAQCERMREQLDAILEHFAALEQLDTEGVEPTSHPLNMTNVFREDEVRPSTPREDILLNAPKADEECFRVPLVMEED